ncbi:MAG: ABC transporter ATP-binding protein [Phycisphaerales bacterium]|nr:ABC transporter ATP-binding protein [Phycisphaerales bacterium]MCB9862620.1 ABC transporter ATP-binding protein [Phycisphaerales bacterium]
MAEDIHQSEFAVDLHDVAKTYANGVRALDGVSVRVGAGEIFGLLGPNGAGKSTLVKIMMTVIRADRADGTVLGRCIGDREAKRRIGYLPEAHRFPGYLKGAQLLDYYAALAGVPRAERRRRAPVLLERVGMAKWAGTRIDKYSKGMLQRLGIAQALMNDPRLVVLDEPTDGLDPMGRRDVRVLLQELRDEGRSVFINSHLLGELELVCDRVVIISEGRVVREGRLQDLMESSPEYEIVAIGDLSGVSAPLAQLNASISGEKIRVDTIELDRVNKVIDVLRGAGIAIESVRPRRASLEDVFVEATGGNVARPVGGPSRPMRAEGGAGQ